MIASPFAALFVVLFFLFFRWLVFIELIFIALLLFGRLFLGLFFFVHQGFLFGQKVVLVLEKSVFHFCEFLFVEMILLLEDTHELFFFLELLLFYLELSPEPGQFLFDCGSVFGKNIKPVLDLVVKILLVVVADRVEIVLGLFLEGLNFVLKMLVAKINLLGDLSDHLCEVPLDMGFDG